MSNLVFNTLEDWKKWVNEEFRKTGYPPHRYTLLRKSNFPQIRLAFDFNHIKSITNADPDSNSARAKISFMVREQLFKVIASEDFVMITSKKAIESVRMVVAFNKLEHLALVRLVEDNLNATVIEYKWE
jgi:hypothetical protein